MQALDKNGLDGFLASDKKGQLWGLEEAYSVPLRAKPLIIPAVRFKRRHTKTRQSDECRVYDAGRPVRTMDKLG